MPRVLITKTIPIAEDGIHVKKYTKDEIVNVSNVAFDILMSLGAASIVRERQAPPAPAENSNPSPSEMKTNAEENDGGKENKEGEEEDNGGTSGDNRRSSIRVYELSDEIGISSARILEIAKQLKINATHPQSGLSAKEASDIKSALEKPKR